MVVTGLLVGGTLYGICYYGKTLDHEMVVDGAEKEISSLMRDSVQSIGKPVSSYPSYASKINLQKEAIANTQEPVVSALGLFTATMCILVGAKAATTYGMFKQAIASRKKQINTSLDLK